MSKEMQVTDLLALFDLAKNESKYAEKMKALQDAEKRSEALLKIANTLEAANAIKQEVTETLLQAKKDALEADKYLENKEQKLKDSYKEKEQDLEKKYQSLKKEFEGTRELQKSLEKREADLKEKDITLSTWSQTLSKQEASLRALSDVTKSKLAAMNKTWSE